MAEKAFFMRFQTKRPDGIDPLDSYRSNKSGQAISTGRTNAQIETSEMNRKKSRMKIERPSKNYGAKFRTGHSTLEKNSSLNEASLTDEIRVINDFSKNQVALVSVEERAWINKRDAERKTIAKAFAEKLIENKKKSSIGSNKDTKTTSMANKRNSRPESSQFWRSTSNTSSRKSSSQSIDPQRSSSGAVNTLGPQGSPAIAFIRANFPSSRLDFVDHSGKLSRPTTAPLTTHGNTPQQNQFEECDTILNSFKSKNMCICETTLQRALVIPFDTPDAVRKEQIASLRQGDRLMKNPLPQKLWRSSRADAAKSKSKKKSHSQWKNT